MSKTNEQTQNHYLSPQQIRLYSDGLIYSFAINFVKSHINSKISEKQLSGLQNALKAGNWDEIFRYINNRLNRKTTDKPVAKFYQELRKSLDELRPLAPEPGPYLLASEFIQHLVAEYNYQRSLSDA